MKINIYKFKDTIIIGYKRNENNISGISLTSYRYPALHISDSWNARIFKKITIHEASAMITDVNVLNSLIKLSSK